MLGEQAGLFDKLHPKRIQLTKAIESAAPGVAMGTNTMSAKAGEEFLCYVNLYGALFVTLEGGTIGLRPSEFEIIEWCQEY